MPEFPKRFHKVLMYHGLGAMTLIYVALQLIQFHFQFKDPPSEFRLFWMFCLVGYVALKEAFRWNNIKETNMRWGEFYFALVISSFLWMNLWNIGGLWLCGHECLNLPEGARNGAIEALIVWVLSAISYATHLGRNGKNSSNGNGA